MYNISYLLIGIIVILQFYLLTHGDEIASIDHVRNIVLFKSNNVKDVQISKLKRQISKDMLDKCRLGNTLKCMEKNFNTDSRNNFSKYYSQMPVINLVPPITTSKDYYTYFNRRKNAVEHKNGEQIKNQRILQSYRIADEKNSMKDHTIEKSVYTPYIRDHAPAYVTKESARNQTKYENNREEISTTNPPQISPDGDRVEFRIQGHEGPKTYIFGFDTGAGKNRQYRLEERLNDGTVKGHYGYYDARGKLRTVKYIAKPIEGYQEKHHETFIRGDKN